MATLVGGLASSHSPQLCIPPDGWLTHGDREASNPGFTELPPTTRTADELAAEIVDSELVAKYTRCQEAMRTLDEALTALRADLVVIVGDDQHELFLDDNMPAIALFWGDQLLDIPPGMDAYPPSMHVAYGAYHADEPDPYATSPSLGSHLVGHLIESSFDVAQFSVQPEGRSLGHAFTFLKRRVFPSTRMTIVPVMLNTYFPPNQPTPARCYDLGVALRDAIEAWDSDARVVLVASGGLSHPVIDENLDRGLLRSLAGDDAHALRSLPTGLLIEGSSEIRNWVTVGAALRDYDMHVVDYVPAYRSRVGSGCGMAFATWTPR